MIQRSFEFQRFYEDCLHASMLGRCRDVGSYDKIIFCGIGGSAIAGEIVKALDLKKPVFVAREELPEVADRDTLCFVVSYSGNTKETIRLYKQARKKKCKILIITSGGKLGKTKDKKILIPEGYLPREAFPYLVFPVLNVLGIRYKDSLRVLKKFDKEKSRELAKKLKKKILVFYSPSEELEVVVNRWHNAFAENSKVFSHSNYFPELFHNEINIKLGKEFQVVLLYDFESMKFKKASKLLDPVKIKLEGRSLVSKILYGIYFGDLTSVYLAKLLNRDYREMHRIEYLKKQ